MAQLLQWKSLRRRWRAVRGLFPLTTAGVLLLLLGAASFLFVGIGTLDLVVLAAAGLGLGLLGLMLLLVASVALVLHLRLRRLPTTTTVCFESGQLQPTGWILPYPRWFPLVEASWSWTHPPEVKVVMEPLRRGIRELVQPVRRGQWQEVCRQLEVRDVMGLACLCWTVRSATLVRVEPHRGALDQLSILDTLAGGEELSEPRGQPLGDRVDMRQYTHGDSPRLILWKVYARTRKLLVRIPERAVTAQPRACAYLVAGDGDEATAGLARAILEQGLLGDNWWFGADGSDCVATDRETALHLLVISGLAGRGEESCGGPCSGIPTRFGEFLARAEHNGFGICFVFVPARPGAWARELLPALAGSRMQTRMYTAIDGEQGPLNVRPWLARWLLRPAPPAPPSWEDVVAMSLAFQGLPVPLLAVDRRYGRVLGDPRVAGLATRRTA